jgi:hypothetical protein
MIKFNTDKTVGGYRYGKGTIVSLIDKDEETLVGRNDAESYFIPLQIGRRAVLLGDSMTAGYTPVVAASTASYNPDTSILSLTYPIALEIVNGTEVYVFNQSYHSIKLKKRRRITKTGFNTFTVALNVDFTHTDLPRGPLSGTTYVSFTNASSADSWVNWMQMRNGQPFEIVNNGAQGGATVQDCLNMLQEQVFDYSPDVAIMQCPGINDVQGGYGVETIWERIKILFKSLELHSIYAIVGTITPVHEGQLSATRQKMARVAELNRKIKDYYRGRRTGRVVDHWSVVVDPTNANGFAKDQILKTTDNIHYQAPGAFAVSKLYDTTLADLGYSAVDTRPSSAIECFSASAITANSVVVSGGFATFYAADHGFAIGEAVYIKGATSLGINGRQTILTSTSGFFTFSAAAPEGKATGTIKAARSNNIFNNPVLASASGGVVQYGVTGTAGEGMFVRNQLLTPGGVTGVASVIPHPEGWGNMQRLEISAAAAGDKPGFNTAVTALRGLDVTPRRQYALEADLRIASANWANTLVSHFEARLVAITASLESYSTGAEISLGLTAGIFTEDTALHIRTLPFIMPDEVITGFYAVVSLRAGAKWTSNLTMDLGRIRIADVSDD